MTFTKYFAKNRAQGVLLVDSTSQVTFASGHSFPTDTTNGSFFVTIEDEILKATSASQDGSGVLTLTVSRGQDGTVETIHAADVTGYMYYTAEAQNNIYNAVDDIYTGAASLPSLDVTGNITVSGTVDGRNISTDGTKLDGIASGAQVNTVDSVNGFTGAVTLVTGNISDTTSTQKYATAAEKTKLSYITVTQPVDLDTLESDVATNNAKVTNANHTGDVTGSSTLGIVPAAISGKTGVTPVAGDYVLLWDATDSALKKADVTNFLSGAVASVNGFTGAVTLVTGNISDTTSTQKYATAAQLAKIDYLTITQAVDLDTLESNVTTNNAKVTNATHTGDVTGADVLGIVPSAISGRSEVTPASGDYVLLWDATDSTLKKSLVDTFITGGGGGDVTGAASSTDNAIAVFNGTGGKTIKNTSVTISDTSSINVPGFLTVTGQARNSEQTALSTSGIVTWNINNNPIANILLTGDVTSFTISGINLNSNATLYVKQDATTARTISWPGTITWAGGNSPNLSTLGSKHIVSLYSYDGTGLIASAVSDDVLTSISNTGGPTLSNAIAIFDGTSGISIKDGTGCLDISGNFTNILSINGTVWATLVSDVSTNSAKVSNATHTGEVTGSTTLTIDPTAISGKTAVTPVAGDYLLLWDATDSALKKVDATNFLGGGSVSSVNGFTGAVTLVTGNISDTTSTQKYVTAADITKLGYISVTQAVDLDTMESNISTNNAKVTNANHTGDVTGSDVLGIVPAAISGRTGVTPVAGDYVLLWDATDSALKKADVTDFISAITASSTTTFTNKRVTKRVTVLTDAATIAINSDNMDVGKVTLGASRTLGTPTGTPTDAQQLLLEVVQGGTGSYTLTPDSTSTAGSYRFGSDVTGFTLSTAVGKKDLILLTYLSDITGWAVTAISKGYPA